MSRENRKLTDHPFQPILKHPATKIIMGFGLVIVTLYGASYLMDAASHFGNSLKRLKGAIQS